MRSYLTLASLGLLITLLAPSPVQCHSLPVRREDPSEGELHTLRARSIISSSDLFSSYDFIICGGGLAGLVLASRLSEDEEHSVLVLEAGKSGEDVASQVDTPSGAYYTSIVGTEYDWAHQTVPQGNLNGRVIGWPRGKILGGSSAMNAMYLVRPSSIEVDAWAELAANSTDISNSPWSWSSLYPAMQKSENFTAPPESVRAQGDIQYESGNYGSGGPMQLGFPAILISITSLWTSALALAGIPTQASPNGGTTLGAFVTPSSINTANYTRSYSKSAYIDPLPPRSNLHILPSALVTRVVFSDTADAAGDVVATGVEYAMDPEAPRQTVNANMEVLLAGGSLGSAKILMHSGVGPRDVLEPLGIDVKVHLPGVGQGLQDHLTAGIVWTSNVETAGNIHDSGSDFSRTPEFLSCINDAVAFVNVSNLFASSDEFQAEISAALDSSARSTSDNTTGTTGLVPSQYLEVLEGYKRRYQAGLGFLQRDVAQVEFLMNVVGSGVISIQAALQHPFSVGRLYINSTNPFEDAIIDPQYFSHFADIVILRQGLKFLRTLAANFGTSLGAEIYPGTDAIQTDEQWESWLRNEGAGTQYHPAASCAMMPREAGGVVSERLTVYGLANVRVADSSVYPFEFAAHLASATFGVAEQAATLIRADHPVSSTNDATSKLSSSSRSNVGLSRKLALCMLLCIALPLL